MSVTPGRHGPLTRQCRNGPPNRSAGHAPRGEISSSSYLSDARGAHALASASSLQELNRDAFDSQPPLGRQCHPRCRRTRGSPAGERAERPDRGRCGQEGRGAGRAGVGCRGGAEADGGVGRVLRPAGGGRARRCALARRRRRAVGALPRRRAGQAGRPADHHRSRPLRAPRSIALQAQVVAAEARLAFTKGEVERGQPLLDSRVVSPRDFDQRTNAYREADANLRAAKAALQAAQLNLELHRGARAGGGPRRAPRDHGRQPGGGGPRRAGADDAGLGQPDLRQLQRRRSRW